MIAISPEIEAAARRIYDRQRLALPDQESINAERPFGRSDVPDIFWNGYRMDAEAALAPLLAAHQQVTAERDEARSPFGNLTPTVERVALLMGQVWIEAKGGTGDTITSAEEFALFSPEDYADCCAVTKAVLAAVDPAKANERADTAEAALATANADLAAEREAHAVSARERNLFASELARLRAEAEAAAYLIDRLQACHEGRTVRDLPEATSAYQAARAATAREG